MQAQPQGWRDQPIPDHPDDMEKPAIASCLSENPDGNGNIAGNTPCHDPENFAARINILASGDKNQILECYTRLYYNLLAKKTGSGANNAVAQPDN